MDVGVLCGLPLWFTLCLGVCQATQMLTLRPQNILEGSYFLDGASSSRHRLHSLSTLDQVNSETPQKHLVSQFT